jgi:hypothetical protein
MFPSKTTCPGNPKTGGEDGALILSSPGSYPNAIVILSPQRTSSAHEPDGISSFKGRKSLKKLV